MAATIKQKRIGIYTAGFSLFISIIISMFVPHYVLMIRAGGIILAALSLWIFAPFPMSVSTLFLLCILPLLEITSFPYILKNINVSASLFVFASGGITLAVKKSNLPIIVLECLFCRFRKKPRLFIFLTGLVITFLSGFMSSLAVCVLFHGIICSILKKMEITDKKSGFGKAMMLIIPVCAGIGGFMTPAGTPANLLILEYLSDSGEIVTFLSWIEIGIPVGFLATMIFLFFIVIMYPIEKDMFSTWEGNNIHLEKKDKKLLIVTAVVLIGWLLGSWITQLDMVIVAIFGLILLSCPPFSILRMKELYQETSWDLVITMGTVSTLMVCLSETGITEKIVSLIFSEIANFPIFLLLVFISTVICFIRVFVPTTTAVVALIAPMLLSIATQTGITLKTLFLLLAFWAASAMLFVYTEPILLLTYKERYFSESDLLKVGAPTSLIMIFLLAWLGLKIEI